MVPPDLAVTRHHLSCLEYSCKKVHEGDSLSRSEPDVFLISKSLPVWCKAAKAEFSAIHAKLAYKTSVQADTSARTSNST